LSAFKCNQSNPKRPSYWHWSDFFTAIDMFGAVPQLEVRGKRKVKSCCGALVSFLAGLLILFYFGFKVLYFMQDNAVVGGFLDILS
jgi:hypothetical protein